MTTDGVTEAMDFQSNAYGADRLRASILRHRALDASQLAKQILWDVRRFVGLADQSDDISIVVAKVQ
jgi:sigma-B regulation protein RsbU (phosphoserine phosphatase)